MADMGAATKAEEELRIARQESEDARQTSAPSVTQISS